MRKSDNAIKNANYLGGLRIMRLETRDIARYARLSMYYGAKLRLHFRDRAAPAVYERNFGAIP